MLDYDTRQNIGRAIAAFEKLAKAIESAAATYARKVEQEGRRILPAEDAR